jgi:IS30 family transposase
LINKRLSRRKIHEVLRLHFEHGRSKREIARIINVSPSTVSDYVARAKLAVVPRHQRPDIGGWRQSNRPMSRDLHQRHEAVALVRPGCTLYFYSNSITEPRS